MKRKGAVSLALILACGLTAAGQSKKAYELIYEDVQILKQQLLRLEEKWNSASAELAALTLQVRDLQSLLKLLQTDQAGLKQGIQSLPAMNQVVLDRLETISRQLARLTEDIIASRPPSPPPEESAETPETGARPPDAQGAAIPDRDTAAETIPDPSTSTQAPKEIYDMAYADYLRGNYSLAIDSFNIYREQFPSSPLADNALYWIGECLFSQRKFEEAIEQFNLLLFDYPQGDKVPAAYLKKGLSYLELGKKEEALSVFKLLITKYPSEDETRIAQQKIKEILEDHEGHQQP
ncbi:MAG: tol-pal system protein YbgF [Candidatus Aminicenantes bacterium]|nr:tol-pal system protein YbgF [Candidatus Aminicenantes bacterium]